MKRYQKIGQPLPPSFGQNPKEQQFFSGRLPKNPAQLLAVGGKGAALFTSFELRLNYFLIHISLTTRILDFLVNGLKIEDCGCFALQLPIEEWQYPGCWWNLESETDISWIPRPADLAILPTALSGHLRSRKKQALLLEISSSSNSFINLYAHLFCDLYLCPCDDLWIFS